MIPDRFEKTLTIPVKVVEGGFHYFYGGELPSLTEGTICDLIVPVWAFEDKDFLAKLEARQVEELLPKGASIFTAISSAKVPGNLRDRAFTPKELSQNFGGRHAEEVRQKLFANNPDPLFVEVVLKEPLLLELRGAKQGRLMRVRCAIPNLQNEEAVSLNHAYRLISEKFEPNRISHAGNVFQKMVHLDSQGICHPLDELRNKLAAIHQGSLIHPDVS